MAFEFHDNVSRYFEIQYSNAKSDLVPYVKRNCNFNKEPKILEIGCDLGGNLKAFLEEGWSCTGIDLNSERLKEAENIFKREIREGHIEFRCQNILDIDIDNNEFTFDLILLKDVVEHIHNLQPFLIKLGEMLRPDGKVLIVFPPWQMPFGGHQQGARSKILSLMPWYHLLPLPIYKKIFSLFGESDDFIKYMEDTKKTGLTIENFYRLIKDCDLEIVDFLAYFIAPIYKYKFGLKVRKCSKLLAQIPWVRNYFITSAYFLVEKGDE